MDWKIKVEVTLKKNVLDPQGATVERALHTLEYKNTRQVRVGKYMEFIIADMERQEAEKQVHDMCRRFLTNPVIEDYQFTMVEV